MSPTQFPDLPAQHAMDVLSEIHSFAATPAFQALLSEVRGLPRQLRKQFVFDVVIRKEELAKRGVVLPEGIIVQRSVFADARPTLFCVTKYLADGLRKVTITFDDEGS